MTDMPPSDRKLRLIHARTQGVTLDEADIELLAKIEALMLGEAGPSHIITYRPRVCFELLRRYNGTHNRAFKNKAIKKYAEDMSIGGWRANGETLKFSDLQRLADGQNRLAASYQADASFTSHTVFGVPDDYFNSIDQGRVRGPADMLKIFGVDAPGTVAQALRWAQLLATNKVMLRTTFTGPEILDLYKKQHQGVVDFVQEARDVRRKNRQPVGLVAALLYTFTKMNGNLAAEFSAAWAAGTYEPRFAPIGAMQAEVWKVWNNNNGRVHEVVRAAMIINAWNAVRAGNKGRASIIKWDGLKDKSQPFPLIR